MSADNQQVITLVYELLTKWDKMLEYTDRTIQLIATQNKTNIMTIQPNVSQERKIQEIKDNTTNTDNQGIINCKNTNRYQSGGRKNGPKSRAKSKKTKIYLNELEDNFAKLDDIISFFVDLRDRAVRTVLSHGKTSNVAKDVKKEMKDVIDNFQTVFQL